MKNTLIFSGMAWVMLGCPLPISAQGYLTDNQTSNAVLTRDPARQSSTEIDAVVTNPAGTSFLSDGLHLSVNGVATFRKLENTPVGTQRQFDIKEHRILPALQAAYKTGRWAFSASFASDGGFGHRKSDGGFVLIPTGVGSLNSQLQTYNAILEIASKCGIAPPLDVSSEDEVAATELQGTGKLNNWTTRIGTSYSLSKNLSVYAGVKVNYIKSSTDFGVGLAMYRPATGEFWNFADYYGRLIPVVENSTMSENLKATYISQFEELKEIGENTTSSSYLSYKGIGVAPMLGIDYQTGNFNFGAKYEFASHVKTRDVKNTVARSFNIPAQLSVGASWQAMAKLKVAVGSNILFSEGEFALAKRETHTTWDVSASATYEVNDLWLLSGGYTLLKSDYSDPTSVFTPLGTAYYSSRISLGTAWSITKQWRLNVGISSYVHSNQSTITFGGTYVGQYSTEYNPKVQLALGLDYSF